MFVCVVIMLAKPSNSRISCPEIANEAAKPKRRWSGSVNGYQCL